MADKAKRNFIEFDVSSFNKSLTAKYERVRAAMAELKEAKADFEGDFVETAKKAEMIDPTQTCLFGYRYGFAVEVIGKEEKKVKASTKPKLGFKR